MTRLEQLKEEHARCKNAFFAAPSPRLGAALKQIENAIKREKRLIKRENVKG